MKFDWYQATIEEQPLVVLDQVRKLGHEVREADAAARRWRYSQGWSICHRDLGVVAHVFAGGNGKYPHALATSDAAPAFASLVRDCWPERHLVTRLDAAEDFNEHGAYNRLRRVCRRVAKESRIKFSQIKDDLDARAGRTQYLGSPSSDYRARLYEKGWHEVGKLTALYETKGFKVSASSVATIKNQETGEDIKPEDWTRLELQVRPRQEEGRRAAAAVTAEQAWGFTDWSHRLAVEALELDLERMSIRTKKCNADDEAMRWMCQQYGKLMIRRYNDLGDWASVGLEIGHLVKQQRQN